MVLTHSKSVLRAAKRTDYVKLYDRCEQRYMFTTSGGERINNIV